MGEIDVSTLYDAHAAVGVAEVRAFAAESGLVRTKHGLWLEPALVGESDSEEVAALDRIIVPGRSARTEGRALARAVGAIGAPAPEYLQVENGKRFSLEPVLEDLSTKTDLATATFAQRRLEYRSSSLRPSGASFPLAPLFTVFVVGLLGVLSFAAIATRFDRRRPGPGGDGGGDTMPPHAAARH